MDVFPNATATIFTEEVVGTGTDPYGGDTETTEWTAVAEEIPVRREQQSAQYVIDVYGEEVDTAYALYISPEHVGSTDADGYTLDISAGDRVALGVTNATVDDAEYRMQSPEIQAVTMGDPDLIEIEVVNIV